MKKIIFVLALALGLNGCSSLVGLVPSFWDDNQSSRIVDVYQRARNINCTEPQLPQAQAIVRDLEWFQLYSETKGSRQADVLRIIKPMQETAQDWYKRSQGTEGSKAYCDLKKRTLVLQAERAAQAIQGRF